MNAALNIEYVVAINHEIQSMIPDELQSIDVLNNLMLRFSTHLAFTGEQMAISKRIWRKELAKTYETFVISSEANASRVERYGKMVVQDYIKSKCGDMESQYEYIERTNKALTHSIDAIRTAISALKEQLKNIAA